MSEIDHELCRYLLRDQAVRAAEDAAAVPSIQHRDLPEQVALLWASLTDILGRVVRLEGEMDAGEAEEAAPAVCDLASPADGLRTERVTLEIVYDPQFWHEPSTWAWSAVLKGRTKTVRVVDADAVTDEARPTTLRERTPGEAAAYAQGMAATVVADLMRERGAARAEEERLRARVAELEAAKAANAGGGAKQEPEPRGWLTAEEREEVRGCLRLVRQEISLLERYQPDHRWLDHWRRTDAALSGLLARETPPRVKVPNLLQQNTWQSRDRQWIAAIRAAGGEVE